MNKALTPKTIAILAVSLVLLYAAFFTAMNWKLAAGVLNGAQSLSQALQQAETYKGGFFFVVVIVCFLTVMFFGGGGSAPSDDDHFDRMRRDDLGRQEVSYGVNPKTGLSINQYGTDSSGYTYGQGPNND